MLKATRAPGADRHWGLSRGCRGLAGYSGCCKDIPVPCRSEMPQPVLSPAPGSRAGMDTLLAARWCITILGSTGTCLRTTTSQVWHHFDFCIKSKKVEKQPTTNSVTSQEITPTHPVIPGAAHHPSQLQNPSQPQFIPLPSVSSLTLPLCLRHNP